MHCCDLLSIYYLWAIGDTSVQFAQCSLIVVICFQFTIFEPLETPPTGFILAEMTLWFAFNLLSLSHWRHQQNEINRVNHVVICFQFTIFEPLETPYSFEYNISRVLWFAFNLLSLSHWRHRLERVTPLWMGCDLLSIYYLWAIGDTIISLWKNGTGLWFAFNLLSLSHWRHQIARLRHGTRSCDLLSIYYLWAIGDTQ